MSLRNRALWKAVRAPGLVGMAVALAMTAMAVGCSPGSASSVPAPPASGKGAAAQPAASDVAKKGGRPKADTSSRREHDRARAAEKTP